MLIEVLSILLFLVGSFFLITGSIGLLRLKDTYSRLHALTKADVLGVGFMVLGLLLQARSFSELLKLFLVWLLIVLHSSVVSFAIASRMRRGS